MQPDLATNHLTEQWRILRRVTWALAGRTRLEAAIAQILDGALEGLRADGARLVVKIDGEVCARAAGSAAERMAGFDTLALAQCDAGNAVCALEPEAIAGLGRALAAPVMAGDKHFGVLWVALWNDPTAWSDARADFLAQLADGAALAITHALALRAAYRRQLWSEAALARHPDPLLILDADLRLQAANQAARSLWPWLSLERSGQTLDGDLAAKLGVDGSSSAAEYVTEDGHTFAPVVSRLGEAEGAPDGWVVVLRDTTHLRALNTSMAEFVSTVTHDMRSPLTFIKGYVDMLGSVGELNDKQARFVEKTLSGVVQMADMVEKILKAGKLDPVTGSYQLEREPTDIAQLAHHVVAALAEPAARNGLTLRSDIAADLPLLDVDASMLESAFTNLVENAVKYTPEGGCVDVFLRPEGASLVFGVRDDGYGIRPEDQAALFQRNVRLHRKEWQRVKGSGLGLFIVKNVAQRHGGDAWVQSAEGQGSTFYLSLPLESATVGHDPETSP